ncbi:MAG: type VI secretion system baseplate subunit TssG [Massilia sp.]
MKAPQRIAFAQLLNLLLRELRRSGVSYECAFREVISFRNSLSLAFPASEVEALDVEPAGQAPRDSAGGHQRIRITPAFIGLLGTSGTLPLHDTERIAARQALDGDASQRDLLDLLSNRLIGMYYEAGGKYRVEHGVEVRGQDGLLPILTALAGARTGPVRSDMTSTRRPRQESLAYFAGLLRTRPVSAGTVEQVLSAYFGVPIRLEQFVGRWETIPENRRSTLGVTAPVLGLSAALGVRQWRHDLSARLHIGPLDDAQLRPFLPGGASLAALEAMVSQFAVPGVRYEARLLLSPPCIKRLTLDASASRQLGWSTFLTGTAGVASRPDIDLALRLPAGAPASASQTPSQSRARRF